METIQAVRLFATVFLLMTVGIAERVDQLRGVCEARATP